MSEITYDVEKTECFPCEWYGGPYFNGQRQSNSWVYFFKTEKEARENAANLKLLALENKAV